MSNYVARGNLSVARELADFVDSRLLEGGGITADSFWTGFDAAVHRLAPRNRELLAIREDMQARIDAWLRDQAGSAIDAEAYTAFLGEIGYLVEEGDDFAVETSNVDPEIAAVAGPQLVVPITNARYALNAANARYGSLYDAFYGTDAIPADGDSGGPGYDPVRGARVIARVREFLDETFPLSDGSWRDVTGFAVAGGALSVALGDTKTGLSETDKFAGHAGEAQAPDGIVLRNNGLHVVIRIDAGGAIGSDDAAGINDVIAESALSSIMDCEDSVAPVDAEDKVLAYRNWLGLVKGTLTDTFQKGGKTVERRLNADREYTARSGGTVSLHGRSLLLLRNVGHLMTNPTILDAAGNEMPEGLMDAFITPLVALHDLRGDSDRKNSRAGSVYIVKPKMHGPEEVAFTNEIFATVEKLLGLAENTIKVGVMDEERRTSANLKECIRAVKDRIFFINTGFLDRTGDEIHTAMRAGPVVRKGDVKSSAWIAAYEARNVAIGLKCGLSGKAQIGKGMWAAPDLMGQMMIEKIGHLRAGANTAWVPSPTAAALPVSR